MKRKLFVIAIVLVLAASIVGASYALYVKSDSKNVSIGSDPEAVKLGFGGTVLGSVTFSPKAGESSHTYDVTLTKTGSGSVTDMKGLFKVSLTDMGGGNLSDILSVSAVVTHGDSTTEDLDNATLTGIAGYTCALADLPESVDLTVTMDTSVDFMDYAEESVTIKLYWIPYNDTAYYLRGTATEWLPDPTKVFVDNPDDDGDEVMLTGVTLAAGEQFKITLNGNWYKNIKDGAGNLALYDGTTDNLYVENAGTYNFYYSPTLGLWISAA